jgi:hypothetical protein
MHDDTSIIENERLRLIITVKWIQAHEAFQVIGLAIYLFENGYSLLDNFI